MNINWNSLGQLSSYQFICGHCGSDICSERGYGGQFPFLPPTGGNYSINAYIYICHQCSKPTFIVDSEVAGVVWEIQNPGASFGNSVKDITDEMVKSLYAEARDCFKTNSYTASVLCCRKLLMHIAVSKGAEKGKKFIEYVEFLSDKSFIPPDAKEWVDHIRKKGNEANHEIKIMEQGEAEDLLNFMGMLLKIVYEFPATIKKKTGKTE